MANDIVKHIELMLSIPDRHDIRSGTPETPFESAMAQFKTSMFFCSSDERPHQGVGKSPEKMEMNGVQGNREQFHFLLCQHLGQGPADDCALLLRQTHGRLFQQFA